MNRILICALLAAAALAADDELQIKVTHKPDGCDEARKSKAGDQLGNIIIRV